MNPDNQLPVETNLAQKMAEANQRPATARFEAMEKNPDYYPGAWLEFARDLARENDELRRDKERLDWLEDYMNYERMKDTFGEEIGIAFDGGPRDLRAAIDAARDAKGTT